ncbi:FG-GAP repeat domain-containing protein, partial [Actinoplanes nipponensis]|uniref:FG-GAP repeat domain-containing protein n=1 Tax=Actinoplanes nipponensis TaxID=135950 RepID=UPI0031E79401
MDNDYWTWRRCRRPASPTSPATAGPTCSPGRPAHRRPVLHTGNGSFVDTAARRSLGTGWTAMNAIVRIGDLDGDGHEDLVARQSSNGDLWFYPGTGAGLGARPAHRLPQWTG